MSFLKNTLVGIDNKKFDNDSGSIEKEANKTKDEKLQTLLEKGEKIQAKKESAGQANYCRSCGYKLQKDSRFCSKCGIEVKPSKQQGEEANKNNADKENKDKTPVQNLPLNWFKFYVYIRTPLSLLISAIVLFGGEGLAVVDLALYGVLFYGMHNRKKWAWKYNFFMLFVDLFGQAISRSENLSGDFDGGMFWGFFIAGCFIWVLPNWIYFKKRKYLFTS